MKARSPRSIPVLVLVVLAGSLPAQEWIGVVRPARRARVAAETAGKVVRRSVEEDRRVESGEVVLALDDTLAKAALEGAVARSADAAAKLLWAERELARALALDEKDAASRAALERAEADISIARAAAQAAQAELAARRFELEKTRIVAPFAGVVTRFETEVGEHLTPGAAAFTIVELDRVKIECFLDAGDAARLVPGQEVTILGAAGETASRIESIAPAADNAARSFRVVMLAENRSAGDAPPPFRPGDTVRWRTRAGNR